MAFTVQLFSQPFWPNVLSLAFTAWKSGRQKRVGSSGGKMPKSSGYYASKPSPGGLPPIIRPPEQLLGQVEKTKKGQWNVGHDALSSASVWLENVAREGKKACAITSSPYSLGLRLFLPLVQKRWAERSKKSGPLDLTESPAESPLFAASEFDPDRLSMVSLMGASDDDQMSTGEKETDSLGLLGASAKAKSTKRPKIDLVDVASEASSGIAVAEKVPKFDQHTFNHAKLKAADLTHFKFPWERGYLQKIFSSDDGPDVDTKIGFPNSSSFRLRMNVDVNMDVSTEVRESNMQSYGKCIYAGVVRTAADIGYQEERMRKRALAVNNWWKLLSANANASQLGKKVLDEAPTDELDAYGKELVDACFGVKSPNTLLKRYYSVNSFAVWCDSELNANWLPLNEKHVWLYVRHLKLSQASATKPASFLEALRFCWFVLGTDGGQEVLASFRVRGLSAQMFSQKKEWQPADTLTVDEVKRIHTFMDDGANHLTDRVLAGHLLHMLYVRARWSDLLSVKQAYIDSEGVYFELVTKEHK
eukprot:symbB.v1.2.040461.t1/scaffold7255.1/size12309/1